MWKKSTKTVNEIALLFEIKLKFRIWWSDHGYFLGCLFNLVQYVDVYVIKYLKAIDKLRTK